MFTIMSVRLPLCCVSDFKHPNPNIFVKLTEMEALAGMKIPTYMHLLMYLVMYNDLIPNLLLNFHYPDSILLIA